MLIPIKPIDPETETVLFNTDKEYFGYINTLTYQPSYESPRTYPCRVHFKLVEEVRVYDIVLAQGYFKQIFFYNIPVKCKCGATVATWQQYPWVP